MLTKETDKARVLKNIAIETAASPWDGRQEITIISEKWGPQRHRLIERFGDLKPQWVYRDVAAGIGLPLKQGDVVRCQSNSSHKWGISVYQRTDQQLGGDPIFHVTELGGKDRCRISNEELLVLRFMSPALLYTGHQRRVYRFCGLAFLERWNDQADYFKRCGGIHFDGDQVTIWIRTWMNLSKKSEDNIELFPQPRKVTMTWGPKTRLKDIIAVLNTELTQETEYLPTKPTRGTAGVTSITKADVLNILNPMMAS